MSFRGPYPNGFDETTGKDIPADTCPECDGSLVTEAGETTCEDCGLVLNTHRLDRAPRPEYGDSEDASRTRTGAPLTLTRHDRGLSTEIGRKHDGTGNPLSGRKRRQLSRLRREHSRGRFQSKAQRNLAHACSELRRLTSALDLSDTVREEATAIYREAHDRDLIQGRSIETMAAGSLYAACRCRGHPVTPEEIAAHTDGDRTKVELGYGVLNTALELSTQVIRPSDRIPKLASACGAPDRVQHRAIELARVAEAEGIANGRNPAGVAAACVYLAGRECGQDYTQEALAGMADVSAVTLRKRFTELRERTR